MRQSNKQKSYHLTIIIILKIQKITGFLVQVINVVGSLEFPQSKGNTNLTNLANSKFMMNSLFYIAVCSF